LWNARTILDQTPTPCSANERMWKAQQPIPH
jgi:hypothetical protein